MESKPEYKPAAMYLRCSTDQQPQSINDQRAAILAYAETHGYALVREYEDEAISGTRTDERPAFLNLIADAQQPDCPFDTVLVYDIKRFGRVDNDEAGYFRHKLKMHGIEIVYVAEGFSGNDTDDITRAVKQWLARQESKDLSKVTIRGQLSSVKSGWWSGGTPPFGYDLEYVDPQGQRLHTVRFLECGNKVVLDPDGRILRKLSRGQRLPKGDADKPRLVLSLPERVALVREIFDVYVNQNMGFKAIASCLNERGVPSPKNGKWSSTTYAGWSQSTVRSMIMNPVYTGDTVWNRRTSGKFHRIAGEQAVERKNDGSRSLVWNDENDVVVVRGTHPAIIARETFKKCRRIQQQRGKSHYTAAYRSGRSKTSPYLLSGLVKCARCGHSYSGIPTTKGKLRKDGSRVQTYYYTCGGYRSKGTAVCAKATIPREPIENAVLASIRSAIAGFVDEGGEELLRSVFQKCLEPSDDITDHVQRCKRRVGEISARIDELLESLTPTNKEFVDQKLRALKEERDDLTAQKEVFQRRATAKVDSDSLIRDVIESIRKFDEVFAEGTRQEQKEFVSLFVERIEVDPRKRRARLRIRKFPAPSSLDTGNLLVLVAGARYKARKQIMPPVDVLVLEFVNQGTALVPRLNEVRTRLGVLGTRFTEL